MKLKEILTGKHSRFLLCALLIFFIGLSVSAEQSTRTITATGTGFIVSSEGYILTNEHVIHNATKVTVAIGGQNYKAKVVQDDPNKDLALLKIGEHGLPAVRLGDANEVQINDQIIAIGCPAARCGTVTQGRIANLDQTATFGDKTLHNLLMVDVTITHGSSGGPLLNTKGEVIGITMGGIKGTRFGFAIPINDAISLLRQVPGFSKSQMGQATEEWSFQEIVDKVGPAVVYIESEIERSLRVFLPPEEELPWEKVVENDQPVLAGALEGTGIEVEGAFALFNPIITNYLGIYVFDLGDSSDVDRALRFLRTYAQNKALESPFVHCRSVEQDRECRLICASSLAIESCLDKDCHCCACDWVNKTIITGGLKLKYGALMERGCTYTTPPFVFEQLNVGHKCPSDCELGDPIVEGGYVAWSLQDLIFFISIPSLDLAEIVITELPV